MNEPYGPIGIIAHTANEEFARLVSDVLCEKRRKKVENDSNNYFGNPGYLRSDYLMESRLTRFQTGEGKFELLESVRGHDIYIITDVLSHNIEYDMSGVRHIISPDDHYRDLLRIISAISGKAKRINIIMPFGYEGRREMKDSNRESWDCAEVLHQLYDLNVSHLIIFDPHDERIANAVPLMGLDFPKSAYKIIYTLLRTFDSIKIDKEKTMVVSPDESGVKRAIFYSSMLNLPLGIFYRQRDYTTKVDGLHPIIDYKFLGENVEGKDILIIDDMINSGSTMLSTSEKLKAKGAGDIYCLAPFGLFTDGVKVFDEAYERGLIKAVLCTNLIYRSEELLHKPWYKDVNMIPYVAKIIDSLNMDESLFDLVHSTDKLSEFLGQVRIGEIMEDFD